MKTEIIKAKIDLDYFPSLEIEKKVGNDYYTVNWLDGNYELKDVKEHCRQVLSAIENFEKFIQFN